MLKALLFGLLLFYLLVWVSGSDNDFMNCNCEDDGFWSIPLILECQKVSDFLIAVAYFSIPLELLYFVSFSDIPFKWVLFQFILFIVLCGLTHLLTGWTYYGPHSFQLMLWLTIIKFLTALVSCATAITLLTLIPLLLKWKVRELFLKQNVLELDQEVGMMKRKKEASIHVRMLTQEIRKSLDKHTVLYITLVELSKTLDLQNCAVWMPNEDGSHMNLTHDLKGRSSRNFTYVQVDDPEVLEIKEAEGVMILRPHSVLGVKSCGHGSNELSSGAVAAIRMPMLHGSNFEGGTPQLADTSYAILVLVLPGLREWSYQEMEIVEVVADQVAVALSHAAVLEESQLMRDKLSEQNRALQQAKKSAMMASQARNSCQKVMSQGMKRPMHTVMGLLSMYRDENMSIDQKIILDTLIKTSSVLSTLINDVMDISAKDNGKSPLEMGNFRLHSLIREASFVAKCLCLYKGFGFEIEVESSLPDMVIGEEKRTFQLILYMVGRILDIYCGGGTVVFRVLLENSNKDKNNKALGMWRSYLSDDYVSVRFEVGTREITAKSDGSVLIERLSHKVQSSTEVNQELSFGMCKRLAQMMQGNIWISLNSLGFVQSMTLALKFQTRPSVGKSVLDYANASEEPNSHSQFRGLRIILADDDAVNRTVTKKLLEKLGCEVTAVSSGFELLDAVSHPGSSFKIVVLDIHMPVMDGFEVAIRIRSRCVFWPLIIALTASADDHVWEKCLQTRMNGLIRKPVLLQVMADELQRVLQQADDRM